MSYKRLEDIDQRLQKVSENIPEPTELEHNIYNGHDVAVYESFMGLLKTIHALIEEVKYIREDVDDIKAEIDDINSHTGVTF